MRQFGLRESMAGSAFSGLTEHPLYKALNQTRDGIVWCEQKFEIRFANAAFKDLIRGREVDIGEGSSLHALLLDAVERGQIMSEKKALLEWLDGLETREAETVIRFRSGQFFRAQGSQTQDGGMIVTFADVTNFKKREAWLTELHDKLAGEGEDLKHFARHLALARAEVTVALNQAEQANAALQREVAERRALERELRKLANTDELTGVYNRRRFMELTLKENGRARRRNDPLSVLMIDLDHFKSINDLYGHETGDEVLKQFAKVCSSLFREQDIFARLGGEEFAALLPETGMNTASGIAERVRTSIEQLQVHHDDEVIGLTVSIGVASIEAKDKIPLTFIGRADRALYAAKHSGRNRVCCWMPEMASSEHMPR